MSSIVFEGNTYTFGATVSANIGTGTTSYVFGGLNSGQSYGFIIWAFNNFGPSSIVGPTIKITSSEITPELRSEISSFAWSYQYQPGYDTLYTSSGSTLNYFPSSADLSSSSWRWSTFPGATRTTGYTAPDGSTTAWDFYVPGNNSSKGINITTFGEIGSTFIVSYYLDLSNMTLPTSPGTWQRPTHSGNQWIQIDSITGIPYGITSSGNAGITIPVGATGWTRFTYRWYNNTSSSQIELSMLWFGGGPTLNARIWGPQLEKKP